MGLDKPVSEWSKNELISLMLILEAQRKTVQGNYDVLVQQEKAIKLLKVAYLKQLEQTDETLDDIKRDINNKK